MHYPTKSSIVYPKMYSAQCVEHPLPEGSFGSTMLDGACSEMPQPNGANQVSPKTNMAEQCFTTNTRRYMRFSKAELCTAEDMLIQQHQTKPPRRLALSSDVKRCISEDTRRRTLSNRDCPKATLVQQSRIMQAQRLDRPGSAKRSLPEGWLCPAMPNGVYPKMYTARRCQIMAARRQPQPDGTRFHKPEDLINPTNAP